MADVTFITGNQHKADYLAKVLGMPLAHHKVDLDELQSTSLKEIVEHKVRQAYDVTKKPVLVEDVSLRFHALGALPGPFIKFFLEQLSGLEVMCRMLDGFSDRKATGECMFGYYDGERLELMSGSISGCISNNPRGVNGFGWDKIFCPDGYDNRTRAELNDEEYAELYKVIRPVADLRKLLTSL
jgi:inosine triphosphate pyrophosphatase